jgi:energy-coupling factor transporter ATP-binding protein EcfA2
MSSLIETTSSKALILSYMNLNAFWSQAFLTLAGGLQPRQYTGLRGSSGRVGYVFQEASLQLVAGTAAEEIAVAPRLLGLDRALQVEIVERGLSWAQVPGTASPTMLHERDVRMLTIASMDVRVAVVILDEPTVGVDASGVLRIQQFVLEHVRRGTSIVIISHDNRLRAIADRVVEFSEGEIVRDFLVTSLPAEKTAIGSLKS